MIYLLHFSRRICPSRPTQHYLGWTTDLDSRLREHRRGKGSRLCAVAQERGIGFRLAEVWCGDRRLERQLKNLKNSPKLCPICQRSTFPLPPEHQMKIKLIFDSTESAEEAWCNHFEGSGEDWNAYLNARDGSIDIERYSQDEQIDLEIPVGVISIVL